MSYDIDASLEEGEPRLHIIDADLGTVRLAWHYKRKLEEKTSAEAQLEEVAIKELFRELFLLSCLRNIKHHKNETQKA